MKTLFESYLANIRFYVAEEAAKKKTGKKRNVLDLSKSQSCILAAQDGPIDMLSRVFNEFPIVYEGSPDSKDQQNERKIFSVVPITVFLQWRAAYDKITCQRSFKLVTIGNHAAVLSTPEAEAAAKEFAFSIIRQACLDLLDDQGKLKPSIIAEFNLVGINLAALLHTHQNNQDKSDEIIYYILYAYCSQLVTANLYELACKRCPNGQEDHQKYGVQMKQGDYFNRFFSELFLESDESHALKFTPFFKNKIRDSLALQAIENNQLEKLIMHLGKRQDTVEIAAELREFSSTKENRVEIVEAIKKYLQEHHDPMTQIRLLDDMLANNTIGILLREPRHPIVDAGVLAVKSMVSWLTSATLQPKFTNSITELRTYRDAVAAMLQPPIVLSSPKNA
jgi:hypothetical protein